MTITTPPTQRWLGNMTYLPGTGTVLFGGKTTANINNSLLNDTWVWNGTQWNQLSATGPSARNESALSYDGYGLTLTCGADPFSNLNDSWFFNGTAWSLLSNGTGLPLIPKTSPVKVKSSVLSYMSSTGKAYMFGGKSFTTKYMVDTWSWNKNTNTWALLSPASSPVGRAYHCQDSSPNKLVMFGGMNYGGSLSDTWTFDGTFWTSVATTVAPSARYGASMVYDSSTSLFVLFGGITTNGYNNETWTFNPATNVWTNIVVAGPPQRGFAQIAFDSVANRVVLFGGLRYDTDYNDTWLFNSTSNTWTQQ